MSKVKEESRVGIKKKHYFPARKFILGGKKTKENETVSL